MMIKKISKKVTPCALSAVITAGMAVSPIAVYADELDGTQTAESVQESAPAAPEKNEEPAAPTPEEKPAAPVEDSKPVDTTPTVEETPVTPSTPSDEGTDLGTNEGTNEGTETDTDKETNEDTKEDTTEDTDGDTVEDTKEDTEKPVDDKESDDSEKTEETEDSTESEQESEIATEPVVEIKPEVGPSVVTTIDEAVSNNNSTSASRLYSANTTHLALPTVVVDNFRFWKTEKAYTFAKDNVSVKESMDDSAREIGTLKDKDIAFTLLSDESGWVYVESGDVRGFIKSSDLYSDDENKAILAEYLGDKTDANELTFEGHVGECKVDKLDNKAFAYARMTTKDVVIDKVYAIANKDIEVKEGKDAASRSIGRITKDGLAFVIADSDKDWIYIESGDVRGFVSKDDIAFGDDIQKQVTSETDYVTAVKLVDPSENRALYYTVTSIKEGTQYEQTVGEQLVEYASQFMGNPYVWGGTDPVNGADCSGFAQAMYAAFGYSIPRVAADQAEYGTKIPVEDAQPGDLIFYGNESEGIYHVVICAGNSKTIEAKGSEYGIGSWDVSAGAAVWATRVLTAVTDVAKSITDTTATQPTGTLIQVPQNLGHLYTYMRWQAITSTGSEQYRLIEKYGMNFDPEGFGVINGRYVIATTSTFGNVGDQVDVYLEDGTILPCVIGDVKSQGDDGCSIWGHLDGTNMVEFVVDGDTWYNNGHANPGTESCHPEWNQYVTKAINLGTILK